MVTSDHIPLETIDAKPLVMAPKRLQRMFLALLDFNFTIRYKKGTEMYIADALSRDSLPETP